MAEEFKDEEEQNHPALKGFNATWERIKHVVKNTAIVALKGAVIGGLVLGAIGLIPAAPLGLFDMATKFLSFGMITPATGSTALLAMATQGLFLGGVAGAAIGLAQGVGEAEDIAEDRQQTLITQYNQSQQLSAQRQMLQARMQNMNIPQTAAQMPQQPPMSGLFAGTTPNMNQNTAQNKQWGMPTP